MSVERILSIGEVIEFTKNGFISELTNEEGNWFLYKDDEFENHYDHRTAKTGDRFYDGNNGDKWKVHFVGDRRLVVENRTQRRGMFEMFYW